MGRWHVLQNGIVQAGGQKQKNEGFLFLTLDMLWSGS